MKIFQLTTIVASILSSSSSATSADMIRGRVLGDHERAGKRCKSRKSNKSDKSNKSHRKGLKSSKISKKGSKPNKTTSDRIAIIGGGFHGILTARALKKGGYEDIVVFEKEMDLGASTDTFQADGYSFDYGTKFIPADSVSGSGIPEELRDLFKDYDISLGPASSAPRNYDPSTGTFIPLPLVLMPYLATSEGQQLLVTNMVSWGVGVYSIPFSFQLTIYTPPPSRFKVLNF